MAESEAALEDLLNRIAITEDSPVHQPIVSPESNIPVNDSLTSTKNPNKVRNVDDEIENVLEILPHLGTGFIRKLLQRYENHEEAIAAVLESNLPPDLLEADHTEVYIPPEEKVIPPKIVSNRNNIFDGDQYDVMTNDNPNCVIKRSKGLPGAPKNLSQMLDDKSHVNTVRQRYEEYSLISEEIDENDPEYNDEYDDSYEALLEGEIKTKKTEAMKQVILDEDIEEESESEEEPQGNKLNFCENPEAIRARYEANRAAKMANKRGYRPPSVPKDVVGKAKGQGQEKEVLQNRHKKDVNKSTRGNHNRKSGATWKRSRGMIPS
ncbi:ASCC2 family protein [Megaselia abdita]